MCGIFGFVTSVPKDASEILEGLKILEYRGYDSWGIAIQKGHTLITEKHTGKIGISTTTLPSTSLGIGHTRWATHGKVTVKNAHPHIDCSKTLALVHNGIFENYEEIKRKLLKKGHFFSSQTDTEVIVHLIEEQLKNNNFSTSVRNAFKKLEGLNAIVVINAVSKEIIAIKNGSPLIVGRTGDGFYISSDIASLPQKTKKVSIVKDNELIILGKKIKAFSLLTGNQIQLTFETAEWKPQEYTKGKYKHFFIKEIHEEPEVIERIAIDSLVSTKSLAEYIKNGFGTFIIACGSASYAGVAATYLFSQIAKKHINMSVGSEFKYTEDFVTKNSLVIPISQSGESIDVIEPVTRAKKKGATIVSIVNVKSSTLYRISDFNVLLESGTEKAVVATKSFIAMIATLILSAYTLAGLQKEGQKILLQTSKDIKTILSPNYIQSIKKLAKSLSKKDHIYIIGRGLAYTAALEAALKLKEASYTHAEAFPGGELKHGVITLIEKGTPCIIFAPNDETYDEIVSNAQEAKVRGARIIGIGPRNNSVFDEFLKTGDNKHATILSQVSISHLLGYYLALEKKVEDPDKPRNLAKSVTVK